MPKVQRKAKFRHAASNGSNKARVQADTDSAQRRTSQTTTTTPSKDEAPKSTDSNIEKTGVAKSLETRDRTRDTVSSDKLAKTSTSTKPTDDKKKKKSVPPPSTAPSNSSEDNHQPTQALSRGQRKRLAKRQQYLRKEQMIQNSLKLEQDKQHRLDQAKRIDGLDAIKQALLQSVRQQDNEQGNDNKAPVSTKLTCKSQKKLVVRETAQMALVLQHKSFQADPFATIRQHLQNTVTRPDDNDDKLERDGKVVVRKKRHRTKHRSRPTRSKSKR